MRDGVEGRRPMVGFRGMGVFEFRGGLGLHQFSGVHYAHVLIAAGSRTQDHYILGGSCVLIPPIVSLLIVYLEDLGGL